MNKTKTPKPTRRGPEPSARARALLFNSPELCAEWGALPRGYGEDPADFDEFFTPELQLPNAEADPDWGLPIDPHGHNRRTLTELAISTVIQEYREAFKPFTGLSGRMRLRYMAACRAELRLLVAELEALGGAK